jgi:hypothetical protein
MMSTASKVDKPVFCHCFASVRSAPIYTCMRFQDSLLRVKFTACNAICLRVLREESGRNSEESEQKGARKPAAY